jgi:hypothetical protein
VSIINVTSSGAVLEMMARSPEYSVDMVLYLCRSADLGESCDMSKKEMAWREGAVIC